MDILTRGCTDIWITAMPIRETWSIWITDPTTIRLFIYRYYSYFFINGTFSQTFTHFHILAVKDKRFNTVLKNIKEKERSMSPSLCLCGLCHPIESAVESMCCHEVNAFWSLVEQLDLRLADLTRLNPLVLRIAYSHFRQDHGALKVAHTSMFTIELFYP